MSGLLPADGHGHHHAWIRDNVYCIMGVWALSLAYKKSADFDVFGHFSLILRARESIFMDEIPKF